jgi:hypothetical protein
MAENHETIHGKPVEKVGVIIVHGIGEQKRFEFLEGETRKIADAIIAKYDPQLRRRYVTPTLTTSSGDAFLGTHSSWASGAEAPLHVLAELDSKIVDIAFHEVWWADINETLTLGKQVRFWAWGLSLPGTATHHERLIADPENRTRLPDHAAALPLHNRFRIAFVSMLFGLSALSIAWINMILKRLDFSPLLSSNILVNYLSGVKIYSQDKRAGGSPMDGPDEPPRAAIRRRMVRVMIDVATRGYDRWYVLAHSLGTIVAWNGLMETQEGLPNYLDQKCWNSLAGNALRGTRDQDINIDAMLPNRPVWLGRRDIINRDALFAKFRGVLTYGSPLERFCALWSAMVPINTKEDPFREGTEWVNVYDPTDPVGTWIYDYNPQPTPARSGHTKLKPHNFPCRASPFLLYSHLCYLRAPKPGAAHGTTYLINQVARWLVTGESLAAGITPAARQPNPFWLPSTDDKNKTRQLIIWRVRWRWVQDFIVAVLLILLTVFSLNWVIYPAVKGVLTWIGLSSLAAAMSDLVTHVFSGHSTLYNFSIEVVALLAVTLITVAIASLIQYHQSTRDHEELREKYQRRSQPPV